MIDLNNVQTIQETEFTIPVGAPPTFHLLAKPSGAICNLDCAYCFFLDKELLYPGSKFRMSDELLDRYIRQLIESHQVDQVSVAWQGGEPTLMGLDFYRRAMAVEEKYRRPGMTFLNTMQTNGTLLDDEWCAFFKEHNFLIGISIDGPRELHDVYRVDKGGGPTFDKVMRGIRLLQKHGVEYNILTTVNRVNMAITRWRCTASSATRLAPTGCSSSRWWNASTRTAAPSTRKATPCLIVRSNRSSSAAFLSTIFDEWVQNDVGRIYVQTFEAALRNWLGMECIGHVRLSTRPAGKGWPSSTTATCTPATISSSPITSWATSSRST